MVAFPDLAQTKPRTVHAPVNDLTDILFYIHFIGQSTRESLQFPRSTNPSHVFFISFAALSGFGLADWFESGSGSGSWPTVEGSD